MVVLYPFAPYSRSQARRQLEFLFIATNASPSSYPRCERFLQVKDYLVIHHYYLSFGYKPVSDGDPISIGNRAAQHIHPLSCVVSRAEAFDDSHRFAPNGDQSLGLIDQTSGDAAPAKRRKQIDVLD